MHRYLLLHTIHIILVFSPWWNGEREKITSQWWIWKHRTKLFECVMNFQNSLSATSIKRNRQRCSERWMEKQYINGELIFGGYLHNNLKWYTIIMINIIVHWIFVAPSHNSEAFCCVCSLLFVHLFQFYRITMESMNRMLIVWYLIHLINKRR